MKLFICLTLLLSVAMYALATGDDELEKIKSIKLNINSLMGQYLDRIEEMPQGRQIDPIFYYFLGHVDAYHDSLKLIRSMECKADLHGQ